ncbi:GSCOCG00005880001-RA-CDS [Cotesia congregata]|nr:GSCOCG00005880001-RA-CDS [Cotesia congregata]
MQRMVTVPSGSGISQRMNARKGEISGMFDVKIRRPSSTPVTIEAKLSSSRIMSAACFDTSEPEIPIATPMSAFFKAGESFTPSPGN